jgi:ABC-type uncharacterized transport system fused permease/ATPase subunit
VIAAQNACPRETGAWVATTDNPDQRIAEDLSQFTAFIMNLSVGLISSVASLVSFLVILWGLSGPARIPLGRWGTLHIPAYLVWAALLYAGIGTWLTIKIGRPLVPLNFDRQRFEADFRFSLVRLRENAESVALYGGEAVELGVFHGRFRNVFENFWQIMKRQRRLGLFTSGYTQGAVIFPVVIIAPRYFAKLITLGGLMQVVNAFSFVQNALSFIINSYPDIATLQAVTQRLRGFQERLNAVHRSSGDLPPLEGVAQDVEKSILPIMKEGGHRRILWSPSTIQHQVSFRQFSGSYSVIKLQFGFQVQMALMHVATKADYRCAADVSCSWRRSAAFPHQVR